MQSRILWSTSGAVILLAMAWFAMRASERPPDEHLDSSGGGPASLTPSSVEKPAAAGRSVDGPSAKATATPAAASPIQPTNDLPPLDISPGFEFLNEPAGKMKDTDALWPNWRRHQQLENEPRDEAWAPGVESSLRDGIQGALLAHGVDTQRIELPVVECRTNGCEIQALGYQQDNGKVGVDLQLILPALIHGSLGSEFDADGYSILLSSRPDQRITFLAQLPRKKR
jgi:hypothetical protein